MAASRPSTNRRWPMRNSVGSKNSTSIARATWWSAVRRLGLRAKFNIALVPLVAGALGLLVVLDYRHEFRSVMDAHDIHAGPVNGPMAVAPIQDWTAPDAVARRTIGLHAVAGLFTLAVLVAGVNLLLSRLVLVPVARVRAGITRLQRGFRSGETATSADEIRDVVGAFNDLGLTLDAVLLHALQTERLATLALLSKKLAADIEPEATALGVAATRLHQMRDEAVRDIGYDIAKRTAAILALVRRLDRPFAPSTHKPAA